MGRWSKFIAFLAVCLVASVAHAREGGSIGGPRVGARIAANPGQLKMPRVHAGGGHWRHRGPHGFAGLGYGVGVGVFDGLSNLQVAPEQDAPTRPPPTLVLAPRPCVSPQIIEIDGGLRNRIGRRVNYLRPFCGYE